MLRLTDGQRKQEVSICIFGHPLLRGREGFLITIKARVTYVIGLLLVSG